MPVCIILYWCKMHASTIIFCNVKTKVYDFYLGVCMRLLKEGGLWVVVACHHLHHFCSSQGSSV